MRRVTLGAGHTNVVRGTGGAPGLEGRSSGRLAEAGTAARTNSVTCWTDGVKANSTGNCPWRDEMADETVIRRVAARLRRIVRALGLGGGAHLVGRAGQGVEARAE